MCYQYLKHKDGFNYQANAHHCISRNTAGCFPFLHFPGTISACFMSHYPQTAVPTYMDFLGSNLHISQNPSQDFVRTKPRDSQIKENTPFFYLKYFELSDLIHIYAQKPRQITLAIYGQSQHFKGLHGIQAREEDHSFPCWYLRVHLPELCLTKTEIKLHSLVQNVNGHTSIFACHPRISLAFRLCAKRTPNVRLFFSILWLP